MKEFITLSLAEKDWTFRALDLDQIEQLEPQFEAVVSVIVPDGAKLPKAGMQALAEIACESLKFKHTDITVAQCRKLLTLGTIKSVFEAVRGVSMLEPEPGETTART